MPPEPDRLAAAVEAFVDAERRLNELADAAGGLAEARTELSGSARTVAAAAAEVHAARADVAAVAVALSGVATEVAGAARSLAVVATELTAGPTTDSSDGLASLRRWQVATFAAAVVAAVIALLT